MISFFICFLIHFGFMDGASADGHFYDDRCWGNRSEMPSRFYRC
jgi:hypothetical protein